MLDCGFEAGCLRVQLIAVYRVFEESPLSPCRNVSVIVPDRTAGKGLGQRCKGWGAPGFLRRMGTPPLAASVLDRTGQQVLQSALTPGFVVAVPLSIRATRLQLYTFKGYERNNTVVGQLVPCQISSGFVRCVHSLLSLIQASLLGHTQRQRVQIAGLGWSRGLL